MIVLNCTISHRNARNLSRSRYNPFKWKNHDRKNYHNSSITMIRIMQFKNFGNKIEYSLVSHSSVSCYVSKAFLDAHFCKCPVHFKCHSINLYNIYIFIIFYFSDRDKKEVFRRYYANSATYTLNVTRIMRRSFARYDVSIAQV